MPGESVSCRLSIVTAVMLVSSAGCGVTQLKINNYWGRISPELDQLSELVTVWIPELWRSTAGEGLWHASYFSNIVTHQVDLITKQPQIISLQEKKTCRILCKLQEKVLRQRGCCKHWQSAIEQICTALYLTPASGLGHNPCVTRILNSPPLLLTSVYCLIWFVGLFFLFIN